MKASNIQVGNLYEVKSGHNVAVVKVKAINEKTGGWTCAKKYCDIDGKTPFNTINGGIRKEIKAKDDDSRFVWVERGLFAVR